jgi:hypothetical protein
MNRTVHTYQIKTLSQYPLLIGEILHRAEQRRLRRAKWRALFSQTNVRLMTDHILIFSDHRGSERFFLRLAGTIQELQIRLELSVDRSKRDTDWTTIAWENCE